VLEVRRLVDAPSPGGFVACNDGAGHLDRAGREEEIRIAVERGSTPYVARAAYARKVTISSRCLEGGRVPPLSAAGT
jgi:hypothetical protein